MSGFPFRASADGALKLGNLDTNVSDRWSSLIWASFKNDEFLFIILFTNFPTGRIIGIGVPRTLPNKRGRLRKLHHGKAV